MSAESLHRLLSRCRCGVYFTINSHRDCYETAEQSLQEMDASECPTQINLKIRAEMIRTDTVVCLHFYPDNPVSSYRVYHYDLDMAIEEALELLKCQ